MHRNFRYTTKLQVSLWPRNQSVHLYQSFNYIRFMLFLHFRTYIANFTPLCMH
jgi:hypothetical protein